MSEKSERDQKIFASYLENIKAKTGKTPDDFRVLAAKKGLEKTGEIVAWLKTDFALGHGHANAIAHLLTRADTIKASPDDKVAAHFSGSKSAWRKAYDVLEGKLRKFGSDVEIAPNRTYINLCRGTKKFGIVQISSADRIDIGLKLKGVATDRLETDRLELAGSWNAMVTHRVRIVDAKEIDAEVLAWLKQAYEAS
jgi:predicted transport protein